MDANTKKREEILEAQGLWKASSYIRKHVEKLKKKKESIRIGCIKHAHKIIFDTINPKNNMGGQYRKTDTGTKLKNIDGKTVSIAHWSQIPARMAVLDYELKQETKNLSFPTTQQEFNKIINLVAKVSHEFVLIHPFENGNGRASRLLMDAIMIKVGLYQIQIVDKNEYRRSLSQADLGDFDMLGFVILKGLTKTLSKIYKERQAAIRK